MEGLFLSNLKKLLSVGFIFGSISMLAGCEDGSETVKKVSSDVNDSLQAELTKDNEFLVLVKGGNLQSYPDIELEAAFADFFSTPKWKYFEAETGEHVVEFTGYCTYMEKKVKAKIQFLVEEGADTFEMGALEFNEVPQDELIKAALISKIFESDDFTSEDDDSLYDDSYDETKEDIYEYEGDGDYENTSIYSEINDPIEWAAGVKDKFEKAMLKQGYTDSVEALRYAKTEVDGYYTVYTIVDGVETYLVTVNVETGDYHG
jgi:hypothetical protein